MNPSTRRMSPSELGDYLLSKGLLHDCSLSVNDRGDRRIDLKIQDVNAAFKGLPEYKGCIECLITLEAIGEHDDIAAGNTLKVFEAEIERDLEGRLTEKLLITFWPAGHLRVAFSHAQVSESALAK